MNWFRLTALVACLVVAGAAMALTPAQQQTVNSLALGGPTTLRQTAESIYYTGETDRGVLDVLAEVMLTNYQRSTPSEIDAMSWACRALGNSGDPRYRGVLQEIADKGSHRKMAKYAKNGLKQMRDEAADPYVKGTVDIAKLRAAAQSGASAPQAAAAPPPAATGKGSLADIQSGMSEQQVTALLGPPSATTGHITGKQFNPFYYGGDTARVIYLYTGKGRVVFSQNRYSSNLRVVEVQNNPAETGYP